MSKTVEQARRLSFSDGDFDVAMQGNDHKTTHRKKKRKAKRGLKRPSAATSSDEITADRSKGKKIKKHRKKKKKSLKAVEGVLPKTTDTSTTELETSLSGKMDEPISSAEKDDDEQTEESKEDSTKEQKDMTGSITMGGTEVHVKSTAEALDTTLTTPKDSAAGPQPSSDAQATVMSQDSVTNDTTTISTSTQQHDDKDNEIGNGTGLDSAHAGAEIEVVVESTVLESEEQADSILVHENPNESNESVAEESSDATSQRENTTQTTVEDEATEGDEMEEYEPNLLDSRAAKQKSPDEEVLSDSSIDGDEEMELKLTPEEQQNEEVADKMDTYEPSLLETKDEEVTADLNKANVNATGRDGTHSQEDQETDEDTGDNDTTEEENSIDPDQDVVSFIGEVLHEDVKPWITEADSFSQILGNKTRGGHSDMGDSQANDEKAMSQDENTTAVTGSASDTAIEKDQDSNNAETKDESLAATSTDDNTSTIAPETRVQDASTKTAVDRLSLEKEGDKESDITVSVVTWNLAEESASEDDAAFIRNFRKNGVNSGTGSDLVLISGQECENIKPRRSEGRRSREFRRLAIMMLGKGYVPIAMHLLGGIQFVLFSKRSFLKEIEDVAVADVTCGIGNVFHNKGAIAAFLTVRARNDEHQEPNVKRSKSLRMVFVTAHMAAHVKNADARDADFWRISSELEEAAPEGFLPRKNTDSYNGSFLFDSVDRVFFCGDLNYRLDLPRELTEYSVLHGTNEENNPFDLLRHDQLIHSMAEGRAFPGFVEGNIKFAPTFKYDKETDSYDTSHKQRIPAWTDRILFKPSSGVRVLEYLSVPQAQHSDHRPVYGTFRVNMEGRELPASKPKKRKRKQSSSSQTRRLDQGYS
jgi:phosphatidylinositol-bisphosphatase